MSLTRRGLIGAGAASALAASGRAAPFTPDWRSLISGYSVPDWYRDAKFGIWAHWTAQCVPEFGDWYGRQMYIQGNPVYEHHVKSYGHPSRFGFMEIDNLWRAEAWEPETLIALYKKAGARFFVALANHHDNLDTFDSRHHSWNTLRVGPKRDIVGTWEKAARAAGLRFGVSNHSAHSWHWWQTAYGYDAEGPMRGVRYDAYRLRKEDGAGKWWEGLDPQELYNGPYFAPPDGIATDKAMDAWHDKRDGQWMEFVPPGPRGQAYAANWLARQNDLVDRYRPDFCYFDDSGLPLGKYGLAAAAHYYNQATARRGSPDVVLTAKQLSLAQHSAIVEDVERGFSDHLRQAPWQTDTCIGNWHYDIRIFDNHSYKSAENVVQRLCDTVSKNGCLLLSIPLKGNGTIDSDEETILGDLARWFAINGDAIYGTRPWRMYGEGPTRPAAGAMNEGDAKPFTAEDIRFTVSSPDRNGARALNAAFLAWPQGPTMVRSLGRSALGGARVERVSLLGGGPIAFDRNDDGLAFALPPPGAGGFVPIVRIDGDGLV